MSRRQARHLALAALAGAVLLPPALADEPKPDAAPVRSRVRDPERPIDRLLGQRIANFALKEAGTEKVYRLAGYYGKEAVVLVFTGTQCPIGNLYLPRLVELNAKYKDQGVVFLGVNANASETAEEVVEHAREFGLNFPVLKDFTGRVAELLEVERTCEVLVIDGTMKLRYRGAVDDQYGYGVRKEKPSREYLAAALDAILAGEPIETPATGVDGCPIERAERKVADNLPQIRAPLEELIAASDEIDPPVDPATIGPVNYAEHVAGILQNRCQVCHRPSEVGPFKLLSYQDAKRWATSIKEVVEERRMPPWHADPRHGEFRNDRRLTARERAILTAWVDQGAPQGDPSKEPAAKTWPEGWRIGTPDVVFEIPKPYTVRADGALPYQRFRVKTGFTEDKWVRAIELRPTERAVVHHIIVYLVPPGGRGIEDMEHLAAYAPGDLPTVLPPGVAKRIPVGSELMFELHYTPIGRVVEDQTAAGLIFADEPPRFRVVTRPIPNMQFKIPPGADNHEVTSRQTINRDVQLVGFLPHMHLRGKDFKYTAVYPDGREEVLLSVPQYDFAWQSYYWLAEPKDLPKGTRIECVAHFDNSTNNPALTEGDTMDEVRWGEQTWDEMMIGYIDIMTPVDPPKEGAAAAAAEPRRNGSVVSRVLRAAVARRPSPAPAPPNVASQPND